MDAVTMPKLAVATEEEAIITVNRWLHREVGMFLHVTSAQFNPATFCWHLPIKLSYAALGTLGIIGDIYVKATTGEFIGQPEVEDLQQRADSLAEAHGITED